LLCFGDLHTFPFTAYRQQPLAHYIRHHPPRMVWGRLHSKIVSYTCSSATTTHVRNLLWWLQGVILPVSHMAAWILTRRST
jgi:hypothetical protein